MKLFAFFQGIEIFEYLNVLKNRIDEEFISNKVGKAGFEPTTAWPPAKYHTILDHF